MHTDTVAPAVTGLSRDDLAALRAADSLSFHHVRPGDRPGSHQIVAYLDSYGVRTFTAREQRLFPEPFAGTGRSRVITVESTVSGYTDRDAWWGGDTHPGVRAFASVSTGNRVIATMLGLLRAGDVITLAWLADNNNQNHRDAGFHADELDLHAGTPQGRDLWFRVAASVGPDNSARMVRRHG